MTKKPKQKRASTRDANGLRMIREFMPPEGVPLAFQVAGLGVRTAAQIIDILLTALPAIAILILLAMLGLTAPQTTLAIGMMLFFVIRIPYYPMTELAWNGQTLGKRMMKIKVIAADGRSLSPQAIVVRNLTKEAEIFLPGSLLLSLNAATPWTSLLALGWIIAVIAVPLFSPKRQRMGDLIAGTYVIHLPQPVLLKDLAKVKISVPANGSKFTFMYHQLEHYGAFELQTLEDLLRAYDKHLAGEAFDRRRQTIAAVVEQIRIKIDFSDPIAPSDHVRFLRAFYNAQRSHLEQRQLFGDKRTNKFHADADQGD